MTWRHILSRSTTFCLVAHTLVGCSKPIESQPDYQAACHGLPLKTTERRNQATEDGYVIDQRYDCVTQTSYVASQDARAQRAAARASELVAPRQIGQRSSATTSSAMAATWWPVLRYGMSVAEVAQAVPDAKPSLGRGKLVTGATEMLRVEAFLLADRTFVVTFYFLNGGLAQVDMTSPRYETNETNSALFKNLLKTFRVQFGPEGASEVNARAHGLSANADWTSSGENLFVTVSPVTQTTSSLQIGLRPTR